MTAVKKYTVFLTTKKMNAMCPFNSELVRALHQKPGVSHQLVD